MNDINITKETIISLSLYKEKMKIYVLGCAGMLGNALYKYFTNKQNYVFATDINLIDKWLYYRDVKDYEGMLRDVTIFKPNVIINLAAMTDLEECELNARESMEVNAIGSANCAALARLQNVPYVYISTAGIFDGSQEEYSEEDIPNPLSWYAKSKYQGELFAETAPKHIILRCGWQMGGCNADKKFIYKIMKQLKSGVTELNVVQDKLGSPTYTIDFTKQIEKMLQTKSYGIWNAVCQGNASRYDVAIELIKLLNLENTIKVNIVASDFFSETFFAPRPASEKLITNKIKNSGLYVMRHWKECLKDYITNNPDYFTLDEK